MKKKLGVMILLAAGALFAQVSIGVTIGPPPPPRVLRVQPPSPGPSYAWVGGYWYPAGKHYKWHNGYWTRSPYNGARWMAPHHDGGRYFAGYWEGDRGKLAHDHRWDHGHNKNRDYNRDQDRH